MSTRWTAALAVSASLTLLAGCGGGDDAPIEPIGATTTDTTQAPTTLSKRAFINAADARCAEANVAIANISSTTSQTAAAAQEQEITRGVLGGLEDLGPPDDPTGALDRFFDALQKQVNILRNRENAAAAADTERYDLLGGELSEAKGAALTAAQGYGFNDCGQEASATVSPDTTGDAGGTAPAPVPAPAPPATGGTGGGSGGGGDDGGSSGGISPG